VDNRQNACETLPVKHDQVLQRNCCVLILTSFHHFCNIKTAIIRYSRPYHAVKVRTAWLGVCEWFVIAAALAEYLHHALTMRYSLHLCLPDSFQRRSTFHFGASSISSSQSRFDKLSVNPIFAQSICVCQSFLSSCTIRILWSLIGKSSLAKNVLIRLNRLIASPRKRKEKRRIRLSTSLQMPILRL
jgi:hypothetical protein